MFEIMIKNETVLYTLVQSVTSKNLYCFTGKDHHAYGNASLPDFIAEKIIYFFFSFIWIVAIRTVVRPQIRAVK